MPSILVIDENKQFLDSIKKEFERIGSDVVHSDFENSLETFEQLIPDLILMDYSTNPSRANSLCEKILEFDGTACIFALVENPDKSIVNSSYTSGVRAVIELKKDNNDEIEIKPVVGNIVSACNELEKDKCISCWLTNKFTDLVVLQ